MRNAKAAPLWWATTLAVLGSLVVQVGTVNAGCGCEKAPPPLAPVRPAFASPGRDVTLFSSSFVVGQTYEVSFGASNSPTLAATVVMKRDFADGVVKPQLVVSLPALPPGPTGIKVGNVLAPALIIPEDQFTVLPPALSLLEGNVKTLAKSYQAVVGADGTVYIPVDISPIAAAMKFKGRLIGHRLVFDASDIVIYNTQGVLMQTLDPADDGVLYEIDDGEDDPSDDADADGAPSSARSFQLTYNRHEFQTYRDKHANDPNFGVDASDPAWHVDGTRHVDHHRLVIAISAIVASDPDGTSGSAAVPGMSPAFNFRIKTKPTDGSPGAKVTRILDWPSIVANGGAPRGAITCSAAPLESCRVPVEAGKASLAIRDRAGDRRDTLVWRWKHGAETTPEDFGDMLLDHALAVCLYDESGEVPALVLDTTVDIGAQCGTGSKQKDCWKGLGRPRGSRGYRYRDRAGASGGITSVVLKPGAAKRAGVTVKAHGASLPIPALPLGLPLRMQLQTTTGQCWESSFGPGVRKNTAQQFRAKSD